ncbi:MAG TPA: hypothetical protein VHE55_16135 [Fimbriimonadaceae bacterium]|nr:hypothetical protein [Fimbriimonadaceae bacterium]
MKLALLGIVACAFMVGCKQPDTAQSTEPMKPTASPAGKTGSGDDVAPLGAGAGAMMPVAGGENMGGTTGGGVGQMAKNQARKAASQSTPTMTTGDDSGQ